jgi:hypothetical protein
MFKQATGTSLMPLKHSMNRVATANVSTYNANPKTSPVLQGADYTPVISSSTSGCPPFQIKALVTGTLRGSMAAGIGKKYTYTCSGKINTAYCADTPAIGVNVCGQATCTVSTPTGCTYNTQAQCAVISNGSGTVSPPRFDRLDTSPRNHFVD